MVVSVANPFVGEFDLRRFGPRLRTIRTRIARSLHSGTKGESPSSHGCRASILLRSTLCAHEQLVRCSNPLIVLLSLTSDMAYLHMLHGQNFVDSLCERARDEPAHGVEHSVVARERCVLDGLVRVLRRVAQPVVRECMEALRLRAAHQDGGRPRTVLRRGDRGFSLYLLEALVGHLPQRRRRARADVVVVRERLAAAVLPVATGSRRTRDQRR